MSDQPRRIVDYERYEFATEPEAVAVDVHDDGRMLIWVGEYKAWLSQEQRDRLARVLMGGKDGGK